MCKYSLGVQAMQEDVLNGVLALGLFRVGAAHGHEAYEAERQRILDNHGEERLAEVDAAFDVINLNRDKFGLEASNG